GTRVRLYSVPGTTIVLASIYTAVGINSVWRSADSGETWTQITGTEDASGTFFYTSAGDLVVGSHIGGCYVSHDLGLTWTFVATSGAQVATEIFSVMEAPTPGGFRLFAAGYYGVAGTNPTPGIWASNEYAPAPDLVCPPAWAF